MMAFSQLAEFLGGWISWWQLVLLAVVIGLIFFLRWYKKKQM